MASSKSWQDVAREAQEYRDASIARVTPSIPELPKELPHDVSQIPKQVLSAEGISITESLPEELLSALSKGKLSAVAVVNAFLRRAGVAQGLVSSYYIVFTMMQICFFSLCY
jgi:amidase